MKKILVSFTLVLFTVISTGCGSKKVVCSGEISQSGITANVEVTGEFASSKLKKQIITMEFDLTKYLEYADIDTYYESFKTQYAKFNEYEGVSTEVTKKEKSLVVTMTVDLEKVSKDDYEELGFGSGNLEVSSKAYIDEFTDMGLTCK